MTWLTRLTALATGSALASLALTAYGLLAHHDDVLAVAGIILAAAGILAIVVSLVQGRLIQRQPTTSQGTERRRTGPGGGRAANPADESDDPWQD